MISTKKNPFTFKLVDVGSNPVLELTNATDQTFKCVEILTVFLKDKESPGPSQVHIRFEAVEHILPKAKSIVPHTTLINRKAVDSDLDQLGRLEVIAGEDGLDPRQVNVRTANYTEALTSDIAGLRVGLVQEGFGWEGVSEELVDEAVRAAVGMLDELGAKVTEVSIPIHRDGVHIWNAIAVEGATAQMVRGDALGEPIVGGAGQPHGGIRVEALGRRRGVREDLDVDAGGVHLGQP